MYGKGPVWVSVILAFYMPSSPCHLISWPLINVDAGSLYHWFHDWAQFDSSDRCPERLRTQAGVAQ